MLNAAVQEAVVLHHRQVIAAPARPAAAAVQLAVVAAVCVLQLAAAATAMHGHQAVAPEALAFHGRVLIRALRVR